MVTVVTIIFVVVVTVLGTLVFKQKSLIRGHRDDLAGLKRDVAELQSAFFKILASDGPFARKQDMQDMQALASAEPVTSEADREARVDRMAVNEQISVVARLVRLMSLMQGSPARPHVVALALDARSEALAVVGDRAGLYGKATEDILKVAEVNRKLCQALDAVLTEIALSQRAEGLIRDAHAEIDLARRKSSQAVMLANAKTTLQSAETMLEQRDYESASVAADNAYWLALSSHSS